MKPSKPDKQKVEARETKIEGILAAMAVSAIAGYFLGRGAQTLTVQDGIHAALIISLFFAILYIAGGFVVISVYSVLRFAKGAWRYGKVPPVHTTPDSYFAELSQNVSLLKDEVGAIKGSVSDLLTISRLDGDRIAELYSAFSAARAERARR